MFRKGCSGFSEESGLCEYGNDFSDRLFTNLANQRMSKKQGFSGEIFSIRKCIKHVGYS